MSRRKRRVFTLEQKAAAVEYVRSTGKTVYQAAQDLDLTETELWHWIVDAGKDRRWPSATGRQPSFIAPIAAASMRAPPTGWNWRRTELSAA